MPVIPLIAPRGEPLHVDEVANDRRVDADADYAKLRALVSVARQAAEAKTRQQLLHARYRLVLDRFPPGGAAMLRQAVNIPSYAIVLPHSPLVRVLAIDYTAMDGTTATMPATDYVVNSALMPPIITPRFGKVWPIPLPQIGAVSVTYDAGYASPITTGGALTASQFRVLGPATFAVGDRVSFSNSGGQLPQPLDAEAAYTIASAAGGVYTLLTEDGAAVTFGGKGQGSSFIGAVPAGILSWMLLRIGSLYENREEVAIMSRGKMEILPYVDGLLEPYTVRLC